MASTVVNGLNIGFDIVGDGTRPWVITLGGRFPRTDPGMWELAEALAADDGRVLLWDRPNSGESDVCFEGDNESNMHADTLAALLEHLDMSPALLAGGSAGSRVSLLTVLRHPQVARALAIWWMTGGVQCTMYLGTVYCAPSIKAAWADGMESVAALPDWAESIKRNPSNRGRILAQDRTTFIETMERWMLTYCPQPDAWVPGLPNSRLGEINVPTLVFRSGASDPDHPRATSEGIAGGIQTATLVEPPWGDREWNERERARAESGGLFVRWPLLAPQLLAWANELGADQSTTVAPPSMGSSTPLM